MKPSGTLYDSSASGYTGAAGGSVAQGVAGKISKAVEFDGSLNSHVTLSDGSMAADQTWTFSAWVRADTIAGEWDAIVHKGRDSNDDWQGLWINGSNRLSLGWEAAGGGGNVDGSVLSAGNWYYVTGTYDGTNRRLFLNGALDGGPSPSGPHDTSIDEGTQIGEDYPNGSALDGIVDEVRISTIARPVEWIQTEYDNQRAPAAFYTVGIEETDGTDADPLNNGWQYSKKITILASEVAADLTNFPVLIRTTHADWKDTSNGGNVAQSDGGDILFMAGNRITKLDHEIESYDEITGELVAWVEVLSLSNSQDTDIYIFYGNADAVDQWNPTGAGVWEPNYAGVWHMKETPTVDSYSYDSTAEDNDATFMTMASDDQVPGKIDGSLDFDGGSDYLDLPDAKLQAIDSAITVSCWVEPDVDNSEISIYSAGLNFGSQKGVHLEMFSDGRVLFETGNGTTQDLHYSSGTFSTSWTHIAATWNGTTKKIYINGSADPITSGFTGPVSYTGSNTFIGLAWLSARHWDGVIDECRVSKVARSAAWIETEHNNQKTDSTFYVIDDDWVGPCWDGNYAYREKIDDYGRQ